MNDNISDVQKILVDIKQGTFDDHKMEINQYYADLVNGAQQLGFINSDLTLTPKGETHIANIVLA